LSTIHHGNFVVDVIVSVCLESDMPRYEFPGTERIIVPLVDSGSPRQTQLMREQVEGLGDTIHHRLSDGKRVFVHCVAGMSRSATVVLYYLITRAHANIEGTPYEKVLYALDFLKGWRACIYPNNGYLQVLLEAAGHS
jgi:hypothetical protein